ncbi:acyclic terpene utilization AtuA family protein [Bradyrhizobium pachyrhizi]|uniref:acyclic terpene utilization AtuA family protein n=1 Tax=Bradyrhizobium pachyrhizi TaxID=280333 RepID=UPI003D36C470
MTSKNADLPSVVKYLVPSGMLGSGILAEHVRYGIERGAQAIATDSGSTDSGASYLGRAVPKQPREAVFHDLEIIIAEANRAKLPVLIGTCGMCGADACVDWTRDIVLEIAAKLGITLKIACLYSEQTAERLKAKNRAGKITPLKPSGPLSDEVLDACDHIVALMGPEPYIKALESGADVVLGGRTTDPAVLAAFPLWKGAGAGPSWHAAKIAECGGMCTVNPRAGGILVSVGKDSFSVEPLDRDNRCTPETVSAHMLYENSNPFILTEPGGVLDVTGAEYESFNDRATVVRGAVWTPRAYTMKLEGAGGSDYQAMMFIGIENPDVLANLDKLESQMHERFVARVKQLFGVEAGAFDISLRIIGWNSVSGRPVAPGTPIPPEVGVMFVVTAATQDLANRMAKACNSSFFHFPIRDGIELPSYAFPFSPAEIPRGRVYEFLLNHVVQTADAHELVRAEWVNTATSPAKDLSHA